MHVCALLVAEILQQLLERVGLPGEFASRLERLYRRLDEGVRDGQWEGLLDEVAELAAEARLRLHRERSETHRFLRQMDERLVEIGQRLNGRVRHRVRHNQAVWERGEALHQAMRQEVEGLHAQLDLTEDTQRLRQLVRRRMESVFGHLERIRDLQGEQRDAEQAELTALRRRLAELEEETRQLRARLEEQRRKAMVDALTGIPNRLAFDERLQQEYARWKRFGEPLSLVVWDVDHFKRINDRLGHQAGSPSSIAGTTRAPSSSAPMPPSTGPRRRGATVARWRPSADPADDVGLQLRFRHTLLGHHPPGDADSRLAYRFFPPRDQRVPPGQAAPLVQAPVGAAGRRG